MMINFLGGWGVWHDIALEGKTQTLGGMGRQKSFMDDPLDQFEPHHSQYSIFWNQCRFKFEIYN